MDQENTNFSFDLPKNRSNVIKVIGVGGGGSNAINYMFQQGINGVDFVVCNTDAQALNQSPVPIKIQLGATLTEGLGAGANPEVGAGAAQESYEDLNSLLDTQTKMIFITAGMGGGTGTGAAPVIAKMAKELDILTVGIVTMPFQFEGKLRLDQAQKGLENIKSEVDSLVVINNNKLREVYGNLGFKAGFAKADEVLSKAARGIAEVITHHYTQNIDLKDAKTVLTNSGSAIMGSGIASGTNRAQEAIVKALDSPLLNDNKITGSKNVLLLIVSGDEEITIDEIGEINDFIQTEAGNNTNIIMGIGEDEKLENSISVTIIATGFDIDQQNEIVNTESKKIIHTLDEDQKMEHILVPNEEKLIFQKTDNNTIKTNENSYLANGYDYENNLNILITEEVRNIDVSYEEVLPLYSKNEISLDETEIFDDKTEYGNNEYESFNSQNTPHKEKESYDKKILDEDFKTTNFIINDLSEEIKSSEYLDEKVLDGQNEDQITFDFGIPQSRIKNDKTAKSVSEKESNDFDDINENYPLINENFIEKEVNQTNSIELLDIEVNEPEIIDSFSSRKTNPFDKKIKNHVPSEESHKRMIHLKEFNYSFKSSISKIDELEKEPAYKRNGLTLDQTDINSDVPRTTVDIDEKDKVNIKSDNSFLHDNAD